jgi:hypothetical protein
MANNEKEIPIIGHPRRRLEFRPYVLRSEVEGLEECFELLGIEVLDEVPDDQFFRIPSGGARGGKEPT